MEVGSFTSVAKSQFSTLGWNHPGFGESTGKPYPQNDARTKIYLLIIIIIFIIIIN